MGTEQHHFIPAMAAQGGPQPGPSWGNPRWAAEMAGASGDLASAMDPTQMRIDAKAALVALPPLIKGYLRLGGFVGDGAVIDPQFNTVDVCVIVQTDAVTDKYYKHYEREARGS